LRLIPRALSRRLSRALRPPFRGLSHGHEGYRFERKARAYCYLPPRPPADLAGALAALGERPRFSVLTPVWNVEGRFLEAAVASVVAQWYPDWELILVDDASTRADTKAALDRIDHPNIRILRAPENRGIAATTNAALAEATGDTIVFLDHDDLLTPDCLYELARTIARTGADFVYSDEDKIDGEGRYASPFFKPDWSPDALMSIMYTCHVTAMRRSLVEAVGGLRSGYDGAQDYDLALRITERTDRIAHVPRVLYHWRILPESLASGAEAKPYAHDAVRRLKEDALVRRGTPGTVEPVAGLPGQFRVNYAPQGELLVSIVVPSRNNGRLLTACLDAVQTRSTWSQVEFLILDNGSDAPETLSALDALGRRANVRVLPDPRPFNYSALNNRGAAYATGEILLFLNDDTEPQTPDWLERMIGYAQQPHVGAVGARLHFPDGSIQHCGVVNLLDGPGHAFYRKPGTRPADFGRDTLEYDWLAVTGACLMIERKKFERVGGFDESLPVAYNDVELCLRLHGAGLYNVVCQAAVVTHHESASRGSDDADPGKQARLLADRRRLWDLHPGFLAHDPFHNPNLEPNSGLFRPMRP